MADADQWGFHQSHATKEDTMFDTGERISVKFKIIQFSDDGKGAIVEDSHGNKMSLATADFMRDAGDIIPGDTLICSVLTSALKKSNWNLATCQRRRTNPPSAESENIVLKRSKRAWKNRHDSPDC